ncbi:MAG: threonine dehydratase, partial [Chitinophagales bacterium]|nr:threonine dehydratase [Chitinophagales bacterium]
MQKTTPTPEGIEQASLVLQNIIDKTPLQLNTNLSEEFDCNVYLKREDLQQVRS